VILVLASPVPLPETAREKETSNPDAGVPFDSVTWSNTLAWPGVPKANFLAEGDTDVSFALEPNNVSPSPLQPAKSNPIVATNKAKTTFFMAFSSIEYSRFFYSAHLYSN
jgi:hypothetical protein